MRQLRLAAGLLAAAAVVYVYGAHLEQSPVYLNHDEIVFSSHGYAIATTGRDLNGRFLPLFFHVRAGYWATPVTVYWMALFDKILPLSETTARLPTVVVGLTNAMLVYLLARRLFDRRWLAGLAALVLALTPAHYLHSRLAVDHLYPLPFVLGWLLCLQRVLDRYQPAVLFAGALALGIGFYSYLAAVILMPLYFLLTCIALYARYHFKVPWYVPATAGFALPVALLVPWLLAHPEHYIGAMQMYRMYDATTLNPLEGAREIADWKSVVTRFNAYYNFYNASALFFSGGSSLLNATRQAGVLLLPLVVLLPAGIYRMVRVRRAAFNWILLAVFLSAAIPGAVVSEGAVNRGLVVLPCAALMATFGVEQLMSARLRHLRLAAACLVAALPLHFAYFYRDYHTGYRARSSQWFEGNIRGGIEEILDRARAKPASRVFLTTDIDWVDWYWRFYVNKHGRQDLLDRPAYVDPHTIDLAQIPAGGLVLARTSAATPTIFDRAASSFDVLPMPEPAGAEPLLALFERRLAK